jgi:bifunctional UDP-N-acetylglucosamine pyrophosphorylase / glucosamine-1-phosphate N-acetyltransferase
VLEGPSTATLEDGPSGIVQLVGHRVLVPTTEVRSLLPEQCLPVISGGTETSAGAARRLVDRCSMSESSIPSQRRCSAMVLAAGQGTRMRSLRPKPLHLLCGRSMAVYVLDALSDLQIDRTVVVVGHGAEQVTKVLQEQAPSELSLSFVEQLVQRGTGDAVTVGLTAFEPGELDDDDVDIVVLPGDTPLLRPETIARLVSTHVEQNAGATVLTARVPDPTGYGRVVRDRDDRVARIVEHRDASQEELEIDEVNTAVYCFRRSLLPAALRMVDTSNSQGEYYLTDVIEVLRSAGYRIAAVVADDHSETNGVNDRRQLAEAETELRRRTNEAWMAAGVTMLDPVATYIDTTVTLGADVTIFPNSLLQGATVVGEGAEIGPDVRLIDAAVGSGSRVQSSTVQDAEIGEDCVVGPYAFLSPGESLSSGTVTGPFYPTR